MKRLLTHITCLVLAAMTVLYSAAPVYAAAPVMTDVPENNVFLNFIDKGVELGLIRGVTDSTFAPEDSLTRAQAATLLGRLYEMWTGQPIAGAGEIPFTDVAPGAYYADYVCWGAAQGLLLGTGDGMFSPRNPITNQELTALGIRLLERLGEPENYHRGENPNYFDWALVSGWARDAVEKGRSYNLFIWHSDAAKQPATRASAARLFVRLYQLLEIGKGSGIPAKELPYSCKCGFFAFSHDPISWRIVDSAEALGDALLEVNYNALLDDPAAINQAAGAYYTDPAFFEENNLLLLDVHYMGIFSDNYYLLSGETEGSTMRLRLMEDLGIGGMLNVPSDTRSCGGQLFFLACPKSVTDVSVSTESWVQDNFGNLYTD